MAKSQTPLDRFLAPLAQIGLRHPGAEGHVLWAEADTWTEQDDADLGLDGEEIAFYAEGLLMDGFGLIWQAVVEADTPTEVEHILLFFWQDATAAPPPLPAPEPGWKISATGRWPTAA
jgi:hypothetical protein